MLVLLLSYTSTVGSIAEFSPWPQAIDGKVTVAVALTAWVMPPGPAK
jgi:hypothetical protein